MAMLAPSVGTRESSTVPVDLDREVVSFDDPHLFVERDRLVGDRDVVVSVGRQGARPSGTR